MCGLPVNSNLTTLLRRIREQWSLSSQSRTTARLAVVACTVLATVGVLVLVTFQARRAEHELDAAAAHSLRDYAGYAGRLMGGEVLRRFSEQRAAILSPVSGSAHRAVPAPMLADISDRGAHYLATTSTTDDPGIGYFRLDLATRALERRGAVRGSFGVRIADTLRALVASGRAGRDPGILAIEHEGVSYGVAFAPLLDHGGRPSAVYGYTYTRPLAVAAVADRVFRETPLLPISFSGSRWNYDTTDVRPGEVVNDSLLAMRITDRAGHVLWSSKGATGTASAPYAEQIVLRTSPGGIVVESSLRPAGEPSLIPGIVRNAQRWSLRALLALTVLLAVVSLIALGGERIGARGRRTEAMQQLALGLRHELNNALASVMLNAELLGEEESLDTAQRERLQAIVEQTDRMRTVLRRLEKPDHLNVVVPYLNEGYMVDLSPMPEREHRPRLDPVTSEGDRST